MFRSIVVLVLVGSLFSFTREAVADKGIELRKDGESDSPSYSFDGSGKLESPWTIRLGDWQIQDGTIVGKEKPSDKHAAVLVLNKPHRNSVIQFSFKLDGAHGFNVSLNHARGHLYRVTFGEQGVTLIKDKNKKDPASKSTALAKAGTSFNPGEWHTVLIEAIDGKISVQTDNGAKLNIENAELNVDKTGYRFVTRGESLALDDIKVWELK